MWYRIREPPIMAKVERSRYFSIAVHRSFSFMGGIPTSSFSGSEVALSKESTENILKATSFYQLSTTYSRKGINMIVLFICFHILPFSFSLPLGGFQQTRHALAILL